MKLHGYFMKKIARFILGVTAVLASVSTYATTGSAQQANSSTILLQGFDWSSYNDDHNWYNDMADKVDSISALGVTHVWFPPVSDSASKNGYLPRQLYVVDSYYGSESELRSVVTAFKNAGIHSVADIVINHRVGTTDWGDFTNPTWGTDAVTSDDEWGQGTGAADTGEGYESGRDLDHTNTTVQNGIITWIRDFLFADIGFTGIRYDYAKGYSPSYAGMYAYAAQPDFCVGEYWNSDRQSLMDYIDGNGGVCGAFDFSTKYKLNDALANNNYGALEDSNGKPAGGIGWWPSKMVTFVDNHDTGPSETCETGQNIAPVPCDSVMQGYAYILTHPGVPTLYWPHLFDWGLYDQIKTLVDIRKDQGITSTSSVSIQAAEDGLYAAIIDDKVAMKIGPNDWMPDGSWTLAASGVNYAVWTKN